MKLGRRRFLTIAALAGTGSLNLAWANRATERPWIWNGVLFGADAMIALYGLPASRSEELTRECFRRLRRLEKIFSLFEPTSMICRLNRHGFVDNPPREFVELLRRAVEFSRRTGGAFDVTMQPLWKLFRSHFESNPDIVFPPEEKFRDALRKVGYEKMSLSADRVAFSRTGMGITLNGIAQGYITDRVTDFLKSEGVKSTLVNLGEYRAIGRHPQERPWNLGVRRPGAEDDLEVVQLEDGALAVSGGHGYTFGSKGEMHHLMDPRTGKCRAAGRTVVVKAATATEADALATACAVVDDRTARGFVKGRGELKVFG